MANLVALFSAILFRYIGNVKYRFYIFRISVTIRGGQEKKCKTGAKKDGTDDHLHQPPVWQRRPGNWRSSRKKAGDSLLR